MDTNSFFSHPGKINDIVYHCAKCNINTHTPCPICGTVLTEQDKINLQDITVRGKPWGGKLNFPESPNG